METSVQTIKDTVLKYAKNDDTLNRTLRKITVSDPTTFDNSNYQLRHFIKI